MAATHTYAASVAWSGSTAGGYRAYDRTHRVVTPPARPELAVSADPSFRGDPDQLNPEQLLLAGAASCQLLLFLSLAARAGIDVDGRERDQPVGAESAAYQRILQDLLHGGSTYAVSADEAELAWQVFQPVLDGWAAGAAPLENYPAGSAGPS